MGAPPPPSLPPPPDAPLLPKSPLTVSAGAALTLPSANLNLPQINLSFTTPTFTVSLPPLGIKLDFALALPGFAFCGFAIPGFKLNLSFDLSLVLPSFTFPPQFFFALSLSCDLSRPFSADFGVGGGRKGKVGLDLDPEYPDD